MAFSHAQVHTTPQGLARYFQLQATQPKTRLWVRTDEAGEMLAVIGAAMKASVEQARATPGTRQAEAAEPPYRQVPGGFLFVLKGSPVVVDSSGKPWPSVRRIGDGSIISCTYQPLLYHRLESGAGVTLKLLGVTIWQHVEHQEAPQTGAPESWRGIISW